jgi:hypothetical protein
VKLCPYAGPAHGDKPCLCCWPMLRYPQPLSPLDAETAANDLAFEPKWRGHALQLAAQMRSHWMRLSFDTSLESQRRLYADMKCQYWAGVQMTLTVIVGREEHDAARRRGKGAA